MYKILPTDNEWERIKRIHELLGPFCDIANMFSGSKYPTSNMYFENVWKIEVFLKEQLDCDYSIIKSIIEEMRARFNKYWSEYTLLFAFAIILNPRCKLVFIKYCDEKFYENKEMTVRKVKGKPDAQASCVYAGFGEGLHPKG